MGAVVRKESCDEGIGDRFQCAVGDGEYKRPDIEQEIGGVLWHPGAGAEGDEGGQNVKRESSDDQLAITDFVAEHPADDDAETKSGEACAIDVAQLRGSEAEIASPVGQDAA